MDHFAIAKFTHKTNDDGSLHSYCSRCFATVTDASSPAETESAEREHQCDPRLLEMVGLYRKVNQVRSAA
jgi:hypothetical protein